MGLSNFIEKYSSKISLKSLQGYNELKFLDLLSHTEM